MRRRRTYYNNGGKGTWYPVSRNGFLPRGPPRDTEGGNQGQQAGWNNNAPQANNGGRRGWLGNINNNYYAPSGAPSGSAGNWVSEGPNAVPPPYDANAPKYAPVSLLWLLAGRHSLTLAIISLWVNHLRPTSDPEAVVPHAPICTLGACRPSIVV